MMIQVDGSHIFQMGGSTTKILLMVKESQTITWDVFIPEVNNGIYGIDSFSLIWGCFLFSPSTVLVAGNCVRHQATCTTKQTYGLKSVGGFKRGWVGETWRPLGVGGIYSLGLIRIRPFLGWSSLTIQNADGGKCGEFGAAENSPGKTK